MRHLNRWDGLASVALVGIAVPYIGYLVNGSMPLVHDPRGMTGVGLVLGVVAFVALDSAASMGSLERRLVSATLALGLVAFVAAETFAADVLLAVFMATILFVWALEVGEHTGWIPARHSR